MLVTVVLVFLACHSVKLIISVYEVYTIVLSTADDDQTTAATVRIPPTEATVFNLTSSSVPTLPTDIRSTFFPYPSFFNATSFPTMAAILNLTRSTNPTMFNMSQFLNATVRSLAPTAEAAPPQDDPPPEWYGYLTAISHWLLILNSSCNIAIYLHKDPKFKAVAKAMVLRALRIEGSAMGPGSPDGADSVDGNAANTVAQNSQAAAIAQRVCLKPQRGKNDMLLNGKMLKNKTNKSGKDEELLLTRSHHAVTCLVHEENEDEEETKFGRMNNNDNDGGSGGSGNGSDQEVIVVANGKCKHDNGSMKSKDEEKVSLVATADKDGKVTNNANV